MVCVCSLIMLLPPLRHSNFFQFGYLDKTTIFKQYPLLFWLCFITFKHSLWKIIICYIFLQCDKSLTDTILILILTRWNSFYSMSTVHYVSSLHWFCNLTPVDCSFIWSTQLRIFHGLFDSCNCYVLMFPPIIITAYTEAWLWKLTKWKAYQFHLFELLYF